MGAEVIKKVVDILVAASNALGDNEIADDCDFAASKLEEILTKEEIR